MDILTADELPTPAQVLEATRGAGVPDSDRQAAVAVRCGPGKVATGWEAVLGGEAGPVTLEVEDWPRGELLFLGAEQAEWPQPGPRPAVGIGECFIEVYQAEVVVPSRRARAICTWAPRSSRIDLLPGTWTDSDAEAAREALRWLENIRSLSAHPGPKPELSRDELEAALLVAIKSEWTRLRKRPNLAHLALYFSEKPDLPWVDSEALRKRIGRAKPKIDLEDLYRRAKPDA